MGGGLYILKKLNSGKEYAYRDIIIYLILLVISTGILYSNYSKNINNIQLIEGNLTYSELWVRGIYGKISENPTSNIIVLRALLITLIIGFTAIIAGICMIIVLFFIHSDVGRASRYLSIFLIVFGIWVLNDKGLIQIVNRKYIFNIDTNIFILLLGKIIFVFFITEKYDGKKYRRFRTGIKGILSIFIIWIIIQVVWREKNLEIYYVTVGLNIIIICYSAYLIHLKVFAANKYKILQLISVFVLTQGYIIEILFYNKFAFYIKGILVNITILVFLLMQLLVEILVINNELKNKEKIKEQLKESKIKLMTKQMEPHFYSNVLIALQNLCYTNPEKAAEYIANFYSYLRNNMIYISQNNNILFKEERNLIGKYIDIQKLCYGEEIQYKECIEIEDFFIPPLTVQPFIENAICHGIRKRKGVGNIKLSTIEQRDKIVIIVEDDGVGFQQVAQEERESRELHNEFSSTKNIIYIIEKKCNGKVYINSKRGVGTIVTIEIPRAKNKK